MITSLQCLARYGNPESLNFQNKHMVLWQVPERFLNKFSHVVFSATGTVGFPKKIFINADFLPNVIQGLTNVIDRKLEYELKTWDGCFMIRKKRGLNSMSLHSWGNAFDINASTNQLGQTPSLSEAFVKCFTDANLDWGGFWKRKDGMHFELKNFPNN